MEELAEKQAAEEAAEAEARAARAAAEAATAAEEEEETAAAADLAAPELAGDKAAAARRPGGSHLPVERDLEGSMYGSSIDVQVRTQGCLKDMHSSGTYRCLINGRSCGHHQHNNHLMLSGTTLLLGHAAVRLTRACAWMRRQAAVLRRTH